MLRLGAEGAHTTLDEGDVASYGVREVRLLATLVFNKNKIAVHRLFVLGGWRQSHSPCRLGHAVTDNKTRFKNIAGNSWECLVGDGVVVAKLKDSFIDVR